MKTKRFYGVYEGNEWCGIFPTRDDLEAFLDGHPLRRELMDWKPAEFTKEELDMALEGENTDAVWDAAK